MAVALQPLALLRDFLLEGPALDFGLYLLDRRDVRRERRERQRRGTYPGSLVCATGSSLPAVGDVIPLPAA